MNPLLSATALEDFDACERLFGYRFVMRDPWPGASGAYGASGEAARLAGQRLHRVIAQHASGLSPSVSDAHGPELSRWYARYLASPHAHWRGEIWTEQTLTFTSHGHRLTAKMDRILREGARWTIVDWKTGRHVPENDALQAGWQAQLYPYALVAAGHVLNGGQPIAPDAIETQFVYLEAEETRRVPYDAATHARVEARLHATLVRLAQAAGDGFEPTGLSRGRCFKPLCSYATRCHVGEVSDSQGRLELPLEETQAPLPLAFLTSQEDDGWFT